MDTDLDELASESYYLNQVQIVKLVSYSLGLEPESFSARYAEMYSLRYHELWEQFPEKRKQIVPLYSAMIILAELDRGGYEGR